jgi:hypothetical protein
LFILATPLKILRAFGQHILSFPHRQTKILNHIEEQLQEDSSEAHATFSDHIRESSIRDHSVDYELEYTSNESDLGRERSAKNDNSEIPVFIWDNPFWEALSRLNQREHEFIAVGD